MQCWECSCLPSPALSSCLSQGPGEESPYGDHGVQEAGALLLVSCGKRGPSHVHGVLTWAPTTALGLTGLFAAQDLVYHSLLRLWDRRSRDMTGFGYGKL